MMLVLALKSLSSFGGSPGPIVMGGRSNSVESPADSDCIDIKARNAVLW